MRKFNPEKELRKIQKRNKNKVIYGVLGLLLIIAIGSSYALYQIRYNKRIIYTTVAPFTKKDIIISVKLDDQDKSVDTFPSKEEGYVYNHIECENDNITNINWNDDSWNLSAEINGPDKCTVYFAKSPFYRETCNDKTTSDCLLTSPEEIPQLANDDLDQNARYIGADPNNYIWFNCDDYENLTQEEAAIKCERWRIIGAFKNIEKVNEDGESTTEQNLVKIIRADMIGGVIWDINNSSNWAEASLQKYLNSEENGYLNSNDEGKWIVNPNKNVKYKAITALTMNMIEEVKWNIGGANGSDLTALQHYEQEREAITYDLQPSIWTGKIALMYPSDYGYATDGSNRGANRDQCLTTSMVSYINGCRNKDWLYKSDENQWTPTAYSDRPSYVFSVYGNGNCAGLVPGKTLSAAHPTLYLKSNVKVVSGDGSSEVPYILSP